MNKSRVKALFAIVEKNNSKKIVRLLKKYKISHIISIPSLGSASESLMEYFGLGDYRREVVISLISEEVEMNILHDIATKFKMNEPGRGLGFTINITTGSKSLIDDYKHEIPKERYYMKKDKKYELIVSIMSEGYAETCMEAAKKAGAGGGTLISGIGLGSKEATKLLGITIEPEKDVVLVLAEEENKRKIMEEISKAIGLSEEGRGICFSLPVESTIGLTEKIEFKSIES